MVAMKTAFVGISVRWGSESVEFPAGLRVFESLLKTVCVF